MVLWLGRMGYCLDNFCISGTPADITRNGLADGFFIRLWIFLKQCVRRHEHAGGAETALNRTVIYKGLLKIRQFISVGKAFYRFDLCAPGFQCQGQAGPDRLAIHVYGAGPTNPFSATLF